MKNQQSAVSSQQLKTGFLILVLLLVTIHWSLVTVSHAKVYIDITSPAFQKLPISVTVKGGPEAKEVEAVIMNNLEFTGLFLFVAPEIRGAEIIVEAETNVAADEITVLWSITDLIENKEVLKKRYSAPKKSVRTIAHRISNDIYKTVTEKEGIFSTKITYLKYASPENKELCIMDWDGYGSIRIIPIGLTSSHAWSRDGSFLLYSSERSMDWKIYLFDLNEFRETVLFSEKGLNLSGNVSPQNDVVFSSSKDGNSEIFAMNKDGGNLRKLTRSFGIDVSPVFSPDGASIAFVSDRGGSPQIYLMDSNGRGVRRMTFEGEYNTSPSWSPDGKWIAYAGMKDGKNQVFMIKSDGTGPRQLTFIGNNESPSFSPDGLFLAFDSDRDGKRGIYVMRINGEEQRRITPRDIKTMSPRWSPYFK